MIYPKDPSVPKYYGDKIQYGDQIHYGDRETLRRGLGSACFSRENGTDSEKLWR